MIDGYERETPCRVRCNVTEWLQVVCVERAIEKAHASVVFAEADSRQKPPPISLALPSQVRPLLTNSAFLAHIKRKAISRLQWRVGPTTSRNLIPHAFNKSNLERSIVSLNSSVGRSWH